jgi:hypothetical protein
MSAPERSNEPQAPHRLSEHATRGRGGFGAFSAKYRARWASDHPTMRRRWPGDNETAPPALPCVPDVEPESTVTTGGGARKRYA